MLATKLLDSALDRSIVPGYTRLGLAVRSRLPGWDAELPRMDGKTVLVTGTTSGIGKAAAHRFAALGARVLMVVRDEARGAKVQAEIVAATGATVDLLVHDVSTLAALSALVTEIESMTDELHVLVNNAGSMPPQRSETEDGLELTFATHVLAPWVLIDRLAPLLERSAPARVITVSSGGMYAQRLAARDLQSEKVEYTPKGAYARAKRAQVVLTEEWARRLEGTGVEVHSMHPGWADTPGVQSAMPVFRRVMGPLLRSAEEGADTVVWLGAAELPVGTSGSFWMDREPRPTHLTRTTRETESERRLLFEELEALAERTPDPVN